MLIGVPKEIKVHEYRVGLTPASVRECVWHGHSVIIETSAGLGIGASDDDYIKAGASVVKSADDVFQAAEIVVKVKEPQSDERKKLRPGQTLYTYLHLAPDLEQAKDLLASAVICVAYETVTDSLGGLPLLAPMSKVAGRLAIQAGANCLEKFNGGRGVLLGGVPGVAPAKVMIIGAGVVGTHAAHIAVGMGADVWVFDKNAEALEQHWRHFGDSTNTMFSTTSAIAEHIKATDLLIGAVLVPGSQAPKIITQEMVKTMRAGSVMVDVAIDQGGCFETSKPTTHAEPTFIVDGVVHYCVTNMPGGVPATATDALNNVTLPYLLNMADKGVIQALREDEHLRDGLNIYAGKVTNAKVAESLGFEYIQALDIL